MKIESKTLDKSLSNIIKALKEVYLCKVSFSIYSKGKNNILNESEKLNLSKKQDFFRRRLIKLIEMIVVYQIVRKKS